MFDHTLFRNISHAFPSTINHPKASLIIIINIDRWLIFGLRISEQKLYRKNDFGSSLSCILEETLIFSKKNY